MNCGLQDTVIQKICGVFLKFPIIKKVVLYGSRAKGNYKNGSDIDLTLMGESDLNLRVLSEVMDEIDELLLPYSFDLSVFSNITDQSLIEHIKRVGVVFYEKPTAK